MKYSPKGSPKLAVGACMIAVALTLCFVTASANGVGAPWISQLGMIVAAVVAIQIYLKYILSNYTYAFDAEKLAIDKYVGEKIVPQGRLELALSISEVMKLSEYKKDKGKHPKVQVRFNYCKTMWISDPYVYIFEFGGKTAMLTFEIDERFAAALNAAIRQAKENAKNQDEEEEE